MNQQNPAGTASATTTASATDAPTPEQTTLLQYLEVLPAEPITRAQAADLIAQLEAAPDWQPHLQAWHRDKFRLYPDLFPKPQRSFRDSRWWQSQITDGSHYGYSFRQPTVNQTLVILESLDVQTPGWDREGKKRRAHRFMNELATLSPELCKPGCSFPHELPADADDTEDAPGFDPTVHTPSAPFVPSPYAATSTAPTAPSLPAWQPAVQPPLQAATSAAAPAQKKGGAKWALLPLLLAAGTGAYGYFGFRASSPVRDDTAASTIVTADSQGNARSQPATVLPTLKALDSQRRAMEKYPDLSKSDSPLNHTFVAMIHQLEVERSPRLQQPDWPEKVADQCAAALVIAPSTRPSAPAIRPSTATTPSTTTTTAAAPATAAAPSSPPASVSAAFVVLNAEYKEKLNTVRYHEHGASQAATVQVDVHSMAHGGSAKFVVRCVFFKRPTGHSDRRTVLSSSEKRFELAAGQKFSDSFDSAEVYRGRGATEEFDGWLVQLLPEGSDKFIKQIGSTGTIEELGKTMKF